jgi:hypothetical protein
MAASFLLLQDQVRQIIDNFFKEGDNRKKKKTFLKVQEIFFRQHGMALDCSKGLCATLEFI